MEHPKRFVKITCIWCGETLLYNIMTKRKHCNICNHPLEKIEPKDVDLKIVMHKVMKRETSD